MLWFWLAAFAMLAGAMLALARGFWRAAQEDAAAGEAARARENVAAARARLQALAQERERDADDAAEFADEIRARALLEQGDGAAGAAAAAVDANARRRGAAAGFALCALFILAAPALYFALGAPEHLEEKTAQTGAAAAGMEKMISALQQQTAANPQDADTQTLLGAALMLTGRYAQAAAAYESALAAGGEKDRLLLARAEALLAANAPAAQVRAAVEEALAALPDDPFVLWLAGAAARRHGEWERALSFWHSAQAVADDAQAQRQISAAIAELEAMMDGGAAGRQ